MRRNFDMGKKGTEFGGPPFPCLPTAAEPLIKVFFKGMIACDVCECLKDTTGVERDFD